MWNGTVFYLPVYTLGCSLGNRSVADKHVYLSGSEFTCDFYPEFSNPWLSVASKFQPQNALIYCFTDPQSLP